MTDNPVPDPDDPDFFAKYTMPQAIRDFAFGPSGGPPPPRVVRAVRRPKSGNTDDRTRQISQDSRRSNSTSGLGLIDHGGASLPRDRRRPSSTTDLLGPNTGEERERWSRK